jgi:hypothetical protein
MAYYDLYGFEIEKLSAARKILEEILQVRFNTHDSLYFGVYHMAKGIKGDKISIKRNFDPQEEEYLEPEFPNVDVLIYLDNASAEVAKEYEVKLIKLDKIRLLRREIL